MTSNVPPSISPLSQRQVRNHKASSFLHRKKPATCSAPPNRPLQQSPPAVFDLAHSSEQPQSSRTSFFRYPRTLGSDQRAGGISNYQIIHRRRLPRRQPSRVD